MKSTNYFIQLPECKYLALALVFALWAGLGDFAMAQTITFDDSDPVIMKLGNVATYEIGFRKTNGSIAYIKDKTTGNNISSGSRNEHLWGLKQGEASWVDFGGGAYSSSGANRFTYVWDDSSHILGLHYTPDASAPQQVTASVEVKATEGAFFDLQITLKNESGAAMETISFPSNLVFLENDIQEAYLPIIPGIVLESSFFLQGRSYSFAYPGWPGGFADFVYQQLQSGSFSLYTLHDDEPAVSPSLLGFIHDNQYMANSTVLRHDFLVHVSEGEVWTSPVVRIHLAENIQSTIAGYRADNGIETLPSIQEKLGDDFDRVAKAPLMKAGFKWLPFVFHIETYADYDTVLALLPIPSIFHPVAYNADKFDHRYPDFLPPNPKFGTTADFRALFEKAQSMGIMVMPYTNPTWWNDDSPTLQNLPPSLTINDIAVLNKDGEPRREVYGGNAGTVMSPLHPFVTERIDRLMQEMTEEVPSDFIFEDQIGARGYRTDFNPTAPSPMSYLPGWIEHTKKHAAKGLATEMGFDRLLASEIGFHGSVLLIDRSLEKGGFLGNVDWHYYPLTSLMAHDKVFFYQHNLSSLTPTHDLATLSWNLAFGFILNYDLVIGLQNAPEWLDVVGAYQSHVISRYAGDKMIAYTALQDGVTQSIFESATVTTNWNENASYTIDSHTLPPSGSLVTSTDGSLTGGIFTVYNGMALSSGNHYLIVEKSPELDSVKVWQPLGNDTPIAIKRPAVWTDSVNIHVFAVGQDSTIEIARTITSSTITFAWNRENSGMKIDYYALTSDVVTEVEEGRPATPATFQLFQNYPNPFNPSTTIEYQLPFSGRVTLRIQNVLGQEVRTLVDARQTAGSYSIMWDGKDNFGKEVTSGIYFYQLSVEGGHFKKTKKLLLLR